MTPGWIGAASIYRTENRSRSRNFRLREPHQRTSAIGVWELTWIPSTNLGKDWRRSVSKLFGRPDDIFTGY